MKPTVLVFVMGLAGLAGTQSPTSIAPVVDNQRVVVWDLAGTADLPTAPSVDAVVVYEAPQAVEGKVVFLPKGSGLDAIKKSGATRLALIALKNGTVAAPKNPSDAPEAFPRPGKLAKALDNDRVTVWDYTFERGKAVPVHFHSKDIVTIYLTKGAIESTTAEGETSSHEFSVGSIRFNPRGRLHTETLVAGEGRIIATELK